MNKVKKYNDLTELGKKRRTHKTACEVLKAYDIDIKSVAYLTEETNMFFKVTDNSGVKYALKICQDESSTLEDNLGEIFLIGEVNNKSDITVPEVVLGRSGEGVVMVDSPDGKKRGILYRWLEGKEMDGREDYGYFPELGRLMAKLHTATEKTDIPDTVSPKKWDKVFYYRGEEPVYKMPEYQKFLNEEYHEIMDFIIPYLDRKLEAYYDEASPQLLHADLNPWNVWKHKNEFRLVDFEEAMYALPVHDMAIALFYYRYDEKFDFEEVKRLIYEGYSSVRTLPEFTDYDTELLMMARRVNFLNYVLLVSDDPEEYIILNTKRAKEFIDKYV